MQHIVERFGGHGKSKDILDTDTSIDVMSHHPELLLLPGHRTCTATMGGTGIMVTDQASEMDMLPLRSFP